MACFGLHAQRPQKTMKTFEMVYVLNAAWNLEGATDKEHWPLNQLALLRTMIKLHILEPSTAWMQPHTENGLPELCHFHHAAPPAQIYQRSYPNCTQTFGTFLNVGSLVLKPSNSSNYTCKNGEGKVPCTTINYFLMAQQGRLITN